MTKFAKGGLVPSPRKCVNIDTIPLRSGEFYIPLGQYRAAKASDLLAEILKNGMSPNLYLTQFEPSKDRCPKCGKGELKIHTSGRVRCKGTPAQDGCGFHEE